ncbi:MAG TPA: AraC family transcriptional regulator [Deltaproteobacteria bacterium]|nr:AraC family transcriptional regulator [Deltaproteobacteria bacterium]
MAKGRISSDSAKWLVRQVLSMDVPLDRILRGTGLSRTWLRDEHALITPEQYLTIVGNALDETHDPALGLNIGPLQYLGDLGFLGYAIISSPSLREASQTALQFWELNGSLVTLSYREDDEHSIWDISPAFPMKDLRLWIYAVEELLTTFSTTAGFLSNRAFRYADITLSYPDPGHGRLYRELFSCPVFFGREADRFRVAAKYSDMPTFTGHPRMAHICQQQCQELQARLRDDDDLTASIREIIIASMGQIPHLPDVAKKLAMSSRTLRRRMQERNTTYQRILDEVRQELAKEYVAGTNLSVDQIAGRVGFSEAATFRKAFKKWTGRNIGEFKRRE